MNAQMSISTPAPVVVETDRQHSYLQLLWRERFDTELPAEIVGKSLVSSAIDNLLKNVEPLPATEEMQQGVLDRAAEAGIEIVPGTDRATCNRQIRDLNSRVHFSNKAKELELVQALFDAARAVSVVDDQALTRDDYAEAEAKDEAEAVPAL